MLMGLYQTIAHSSQLLPRSASSRTLPTASPCVDHRAKILQCLRVRIPRFIERAIRSDKFPSTPGIQLQSQRMVVLLPGQLCVLRTADWWLDELHPTSLLIHGTRSLDISNRPGTTRLLQVGSDLEHLRTYTTDLAAPSGVLDQANHPSRLCHVVRPTRERSRLRNSISSQPSAVPR
ncbi:uncharacterized protein B0I36DRAFT_25881 [Microdochium trichocladiopsis]|uniref:Uncharacterized protein n=1 Tax=Microdochium trichocladiopsis TaxID=1682393 RepID=A0A9P8XVB7_9PEZI|nr:uncharacterized protein B0I36DRAFT_25881 [Microdochium trichocladiopsis]KAH7020840.1 hypothetical protein B0I36DRAFT_25881 [Microdochium trichocladiopsis]